MTLCLFLESALRSLVLGVVMWLGLKTFRVRNPQVELMAWTVVLATALAMPLLLQVATVSIPPRMSVPASVASVMTAQPAPVSFEAPSSWVDPIMPPPSQAVTPQPFDWAAWAWVGYLLITGVLLLRLSIGVAMTWRLSRTARPVREDWAGNADVRICNEIGMPVTFGWVILLPADCAEWSALKRQAVLSHERSHVARGDYLVLLLATLHRALFWFNPLSWWLLNRLAVLMESASDDAAVAALRDRFSYAEVLLDIASCGGRPPAGVAMARASTVAGRVARILRENTLPVKLGWQGRALVAATLLPVTAMAAVTITQSMPTESLQSFAEGMPALSAVELAPVSLGNLAPNLLAPPRMQYRVLPVAIKAQVTVAPMPATIPAVASSDTTDASSQPPASDGAKPVDMSGTWTMVSGGLGVSCTFQQTGNTLAGTCKTLSQEGPVKGLIDGRKVEWRWLFNGGKVGIIHDFKVAEYKATLLPDNRLEGGYYVYNTYDKFHPSFDYKTSILIPRPPGRYFMAKHAVAPVSAIPTLPAQSAAVQEPAARPVAADGIQPANMTGTWSIFGIPPNQRLRSDVGPPLRPSYCSFRQTGNTLSGTCKNNFFENAVTGSVTGRTVHFDWIYWLGLHPNDNPAFTLRRASFDGTIGPDNVLHGTYKNRFAYRPEPRTPGGTFWAEKQPSDPS